MLDTDAKLSANSKLAQTARTIPVSVVSRVRELPKELQDAGVQLFAAEQHDGLLALPEFVEDLAASGLSSLMVEGGAKVAKSFLEQGLVDHIWLFTSTMVLGENGIVSPVNNKIVPERFMVQRRLKLGADELQILQKA